MKLTEEEEAGWWQANSSLPWWQLILRVLISSGPIPNHIAFVMDGNRRYARTKHLESVVKGHEKGFSQLARVIDWCNRFGIKEITVYAFSIENFKRSDEEVNGLMRLAEEKFQKLIDDKEKLNEKRVCFKFYGKRELLSRKLQSLMQQIEEYTSEFENGRLNICMPYTSRDELARSFEQIRQDVMTGKLNIDEVDERLIDGYLDSKTGSHIDLFVRTSGERRLSDFMMWQAADTHIFISDVLWPDYDYYNFCKSILSYQYYKCSIKSVCLDFMD